MADSASIVLSNSPHSMIRVECSDGQVIDVDREMAMAMSGAIRKRLEGGDKNSSTILLDTMTSSTLEKVLEFCSVHTSTHAQQNLKIWDEKFVRLEPGELCELASAAYYLEIKPLVDLTCKAIAKLLKGKPPAEIRRTFNILYDFSPGDDVPPPTIRDKLRNKLHYKQKEKFESKNNSAESSDPRSVDDLVSFIDGKSAKKKAKQKAKKTSKAVTPTNGNASPTIARELDRPQPLEHPSNKEVLANLMNNISDDIWSSNEEEEESDPLDPELKAAQDKEVEEFRMRLESIQRNDQRPKVTIPALDEIVGSINAGKA